MGLQKQNWFLQNSFFSNCLGSLLILFDPCFLLCFWSHPQPPWAAKPQLQASTQLVQLSRRSCCPSSSRVPQSVCRVISAGKCLHKQHRDAMALQKQNWFLPNSFFFQTVWDPCWFFLILVFSSVVGPTLNPLEQERHSCRLRISNCSFLGGLVVLLQSFLRACAEWPLLGNVYTNNIANAMGLQKQNWFLQNSFFFQTVWDPCWFFLILVFSSVVGPTLNPLEQERHSCRLRLSNCSFLGGLVVLLQSFLRACAEWPLLGNVYTNNIANAMGLQKTDWLIQNSFY